MTYTFEYEAVGLYPYEYAKADPSWKYARCRETYQDIEQNLREALYNDPSVGVMQRYHVYHQHLMEVMHGHLRD